MSFDPMGPGSRFLEGPRPFVDDEGLDPDEDEEPDDDEDDDETPEDSE